MQGVGAIVNRQGILDTVQFEFPPGNAVAVSSDQGAEMRMPLEVISQRFAAEHDILEFTMPVRHLEGNDNTTVVRDPGFHSLTVLQGVKVNGGAIHVLAKCYPANHK